MQNLKRHQKKGPVETETRKRPREARRHRVTRMLRKAVEEALIHFAAALKTTAGDDGQAG